MNESITLAGFHLFLVRHGESSNNALPDTQRVSDPALTELGQEQVYKLGQYYRQLERIDQVLSSPFRRTLQTTQPLLDARDMRATIWTEIFEVGGCFNGHKPGARTGDSGMTHTQIAKEFPRFDIPDDIDQDGWYKCRPFETHELAVQRAATQAKRIRSTFENTDQVVFCVIHADFKQLLLQQLVPNQPQYHGADIGNTSVTHFHFHDGETDVLSYCDTSHLDQ